jgi:outer membrane protein assembly factor BamB
VAEKPAGKVEVPARPWSTYHGNNGLTGLADPLGADALAVRWRFLAGAKVEQTPVAEEGRIFVANRRGEVFGIAVDGQKIWSKQFFEPSKNKPDAKPREESIDAPLAVFQGTLLVATASGSLYALNTATGEERWHSTIEGTFLGTPNYVDGTPGAYLAINQSDASLHAFDVKTGATLWGTDSIDRCDGSPGVGKDFAVYGSCAAALHVIGTAEKKLLRSIDIDGDSQVAGGVAVDGDSVFSGCRSGKLLHANVRTGKIVWINPVAKAEIFTTPAVNAQWVLAVADDGQVFGVDRATGQTRWTVKPGSKPKSPVIAGDRVLLSARGTLYVLSLEDGRTLWSGEAGDEISSPAVAFGLVLVGGDDGAVTAFGPVPK